MIETKVIFGLDMETDVGNWTPLYMGLEKGTPWLLDTLKEKKIKATFFFTGEAARRYPEVLRQISKEGHEIGCHALYHEILGDMLFPVPGIKPLLKEEIPLRIKKATETVSKIAGRKMLSFRCPQLFGSTTVVNNLEKLGYLADLSLPLYYYKKPFIPYHPSCTDWTQEGKMHLLEIPNFADITQKSHDTYGRDLDQWPIFRTKGAEKLFVHIENFIAFVKEKGLFPVLAFYFHPWEFVHMPEEFHFGEGKVVPDEFITKNCGSYARDQFRKLIDLLLDLPASFYTAEQLALEEKQE